MLKQINSKDNPTFRQLLDLVADRSARRQSGKTLLDGEHLLLAALASGYQPSLLVFSETGWSGTMADWSRRLPEVPALVLSDALFKRLSPVESPTGLLAEISIPHSERSPDGCMVMLEDVRDPGNLGAILRVAAAAGCSAAYLSKGCAEAWSPKCLRGGQGAHFLLAIHEQVDLVGRVQSQTVPVYAAVLGETCSLYALDLHGTLAFAFGNEGAGLSDRLIEVCRPFSIPMPGQVESLNVATAAAICLFERVRQLA